MNHLPNATRSKRFDAILSQNIQPEDNIWKFQLPVPPLPENQVDAFGNQKIWVKVLTINKDNEIRLSIDKQSTNRILSSDARDKFILTSFANFRFPDTPPKITTDYIERFLKSGVYINGVKYIFYGHSNSQLKSRTCYLFAAGRGDEIMAKINSLGDFSKLTSAAKRAKRIGLLFSAAESAVQLNPQHTEDIEDIENNGYAFTDGCGMLSKAFAIELAKKRGIIFHNNRYCPSAFQIRYKGYKGMLMMNPTLKKKTSFRDSMKKFKGCSDNTFSVLDYSKPFTFACLNGELVTLLSCLGIPDEVFLKKQEEYFDFLKNASVHPYTAFQFYCYKLEADQAEKVLLHGLTESHLKANIKKLVKAEWTGTFKKNEVRDGNERVRILIKKSRILFGVCDYTGILSEGQCHVRITSETGGPKSLDGADVIVSRNPCLHPGDIRKFRAVEAKDLDHLVDCIVFPIVGSRDAASLMSGGDLDGDKFFVSWDPDIIPKKMFEPYGYPPAKEAPSRDIKYDDMINYFARYTNSSLGKVKNLYLDWVRVSEEGAGSKECQELNKLFSSCVDGERIKIPEHLESPPKPPEGMPFILDLLCENVKKIGMTFFEEDLDVFEWNSKLLLHDLLIFSDLCLIDEFELFQLTLRWCRRNVHNIQEFLCYFDFGAFTLLQKHTVLISLTEEDLSLREQYIGPIYNGLHQSRLLTCRELVSCKLDSPDIRWQLLYDSNEDGGHRLYPSMEKAMEDFDKKLLVINVDEQLKVALYIPKKMEKGKDLDVGGVRGSSTKSNPQEWGRRRGESRSQGQDQRPKQGSEGLTTLQKIKSFPTVKLFAFDPLSGHFYKQTTVVGYQLSYDGEIIQLYEKRKPNTFIWFGLNEKWSMRNGIIKKSEDKSQFKVSIALQKFSDRLSQSHHRVTKQASSGIEIYVISNRDRVGHNILDITMNQIDTVEVKKILQNIPKEYQTPIEGVDFQFREFCRPILVDGKLQDLSTFQDACQMEQLLHCCVALNDDKRLFQILEAILWDQKLIGMLDFNLLRKLCDEVPSLSMLVIPALENGTILLPVVINKKNFVFSLLNCLLITCNEVKESSFILFKKILAWMYANEMRLTITELVDLVKRVLLTIRHSNLAEEFILEVFKDETPVFQADGSDSSTLAEFVYAKHFILALALDYLGEIRECCPCDFRGIPLGAEEYGLGTDSSTSNSRLTNTYTLAQHLSSKFKELKLDEGGDVDPENGGSDSRRSTKLQPDQICLEISYSPRSVGLYETILRTDIVCKIRNEDHIRFCASKRSSNNPKKRISVFDAVVQSIQRGKMEFRILQTEPLELTTASWNLYICGSTTNFTIQMLAIKTLLEKRSMSTVAYADIAELSDRPPTSAEGAKQPNLHLQLPEGKFNESQERAIREALIHPVTLIWGPPGTGKTTVVVQIIMQFLLLHPSLRLLVTASTHNAVDNVMERFIKERKALGDLQSDDAIRLTSEVSKVTGDLKKWTLDAFVGKDLHLNDKAKGEALKKLKEARIVFSTCSGAGVGMLRGVDHTVSVLSLGGAENDDVDEHAGEKKIKKKMKSEQKFDIVIVDEASQITEPNALIPIVKSSKYVILVGDHVQLCPTVTETAKSHGLEKSLFEKLYTSSSSRVQKVMLDTQYRMHPDLVKFPSKSFYDGKLKTGIKKEDHPLPHSKFPWPTFPPGSDDPYRCVFLNCPTPESYGDSSKFNIGQVNLTMKVVKLLRSDGVADFPKIVVLTPYAKQKEKTIQAIKTSSWASGVEVNTIDGFQGREADIIIFCTVRGNLHKSLGFSDDPRRVNVALTRAKYGIVVIGHEETLAGGEITKSMVASCLKIDNHDDLSLGKQ